MAPSKIEKPSSADSPVKKAKSSSGSVAKRAAKPSRPKRAAVEAGGDDSQAMVPISAQELIEIGENPHISLENIRLMFFKSATGGFNLASNVHPWAMQRVKELSKELCDRVLLYLQNSKQKRVSLEMFEKGIHSLDYNL